MCFFKIEIQLSNFVDKEDFSTENLEEDAESERSEESENETQHIQKTQKETIRKMSIF